MQFYPFVIRACADAGKPIFEGIFVKRMRECSALRRQQNRKRDVDFINTNVGIAVQIPDKRCLAISCAVGRVGTQIESQTTVNIKRFT